MNTLYTLSIRGDVGGYHTHYASLEGAMKGAISALNDKEAVLEAHPDNDTNEYKTWWVMSGTGSKFTRLRGFIHASSVQP